MGKRNSKGGSKKSKSKNRREKNNKSDLSKQQETSQKSADEYVSENIAESSAEQNENSDKNSDEGILENNDINIDESILGNNETNTTESTSETNSKNNNTTNETNDCYEEMKAKQQELLNKVKNLTESLVAITLIRDNVNSIRVDTLTELYFTRQVRPLLDALAIIAFAVSNMTTAAVNIQTNTFGDRKEIRHALNLSYKMNDEVDDVINSLDRRLKIFIDQIDKIDKNCPPFDFKRDS